MTNHAELMRTLGAAARQAGRAVARADGETRNQALLACATAIEAGAAALTEANALDLDAAGQRGLAGALVDRLTLTPARIQGMADGLREVAAFPDPVGEIRTLRTRPNGLRAVPRTVPARRRSVRRRERR